MIHGQSFLNSPGKSCSLLNVCQYALNACFTLNVLYLNGKAHELQVQAWTTVKEVKEMLAAKTSVPALALQFFCEDVALDGNHSPLSYYVIGPFNATVNSVRASGLVVSGGTDASICGSLPAQGFAQRKANVCKI